MVVIIKCIKTLKSGLGIVLVFALLLTSVPVINLSASSLEDIVLLAQEPYDDIFLPVGGISPFIEIPVPEEEMPYAETLATAQIKSPLLRAYVKPQIPGGTRYCYDWVSNPANTNSSDSGILTSLYEAFVTYANIAYQLTSSYTNGGGYYHAGALGTSLISLPINIAGGSINQSGSDTVKSLQLIWLALSAFSRDNPQYYMFENGFYYSYTTGSSARITSLYPMVSGEYSTYSERQRINAIIEAKYAEYESLASSVNNDFEKARIVHDKILAERDYSYYSGAPDLNAYAHNILGVLDLATQGPVCESYAETYAYILNRLGIETLIVFGQAGSGGSGGGGGHSWNMVKINGNYYYADPTWNDFETVGNASGSKNDEGNLKNDLYYRYFLVGGTNTTFTSSHAAGTPSGGNLYYQPGLPAVASSDYNMMTGSAYKWITDNGYYNSSYSYGPDYNYCIGYSNIVGYPAEDPNALFINNSGWKFNGWRIRDFGSYTVSPTATDIPVAGAIWHWDFDRTKGGFNNQLSHPVAMTQNTDYEIIVKKPYYTGWNRAYIYGKGFYRGIDFALVNLAFASASASITNLTVSGTSGTALTGTPTATVTLTNASVARGGLSNVNATSWFGGSIPAGVMATANGSSLSNIITITFSGTPAAESSAAFNITIPASFQTSGQNMTVITNTNAKFSITTSFSKMDQENLSITGLNSTYTYGDGKVTLGTEGGSGTGMVSYASNNTNVATVSGNIVTIAGAGSFTITATKDGDSTYNEKIVTSSTVTVNPKGLIVNVTVKNKHYDGLTAAAIESASLAGVVSGDTVLLVTPYPAASFENSDVGSAKPISFSGSFVLNGAGALNYTLIQPSGITASILTGFTPVNGTHYTAGEMNQNGWRKTGFVITASSGYQISTVNTADGPWQSNLAYSAETSTGSVIFYLRNISTGEISVGKAENYKIDKTVPAGTITVSSSSYIFTEFLNTITFGMFFKNTVWVTIEGSDSGSGIDRIEYYKSASALADTTNWDAVAWIDSTGLELISNWKGSVYARITDRAGNAAVVNSNGVVVYTDSAAAANGGFSKGSNDDLEITVNMNGNSVKDITNGGYTLVLGTDYTAGTNKIIFKNTYLKSLADGTQNITVTYCPLGETGTQTGGDTPGTTVISIVVETPSTETTGIIEDTSEPSTPSTSGPTEPITQTSSCVTEPVTKPTAKTTEPITQTTLIPTKPHTQPAPDPTEPITQTTLIPTNPHTQPASDPTEPITQTTLSPTKPANTQPTSDPAEPVTQIASEPTSVISLPKAKWGDINLDGKVNIKDVTYLQKYIAKIEGYKLNEIQRINADADQNGKVNIRDATYIQKVIARIIVDSNIPV